jgi:hypothetical protein
LNNCSLPFVGLNGAASRDLPQDAVVCQKPQAFFAKILLAKAVEKRQNL